MDPNEAPRRSESNTSAPPKYEPVPAPGAYLSVQPQFSTETPYYAHPPASPAPQPNYGTYMTEPPQPPPYNIPLNATPPPYAPGAYCAPPRLQYVLGTTYHEQQPIIRRPIDSDEDMTAANCSVCLAILVPIVGVLVALALIITTPKFSRRRRVASIALFIGLILTAVWFCIYYSVGTNM